MHACKDGGVGKQAHIMKAAAPCQVDEGSCSMPGLMKAAAPCQVDEGSCSMPGTMKAAAPCWIWSSFPGSTWHNVYVWCNET